ncbi:conserved hypothetical protein [uncultured Mycobacterium sp.]|jgi:WXG100 family type VII secretion target|uniref:Uncharacterized protein n=1 Tax=uncultured Mycobacterium sp. TaxID=171292 RepID=A0A1Y5PD07_9MYCO|nr:conserved hypothetical protein [uncultured Mycobacterium sp.]
MAVPGSDGSGTTSVDHGAVVDLANKMDELSHRAQDVLTRYKNAVEDAQNGVLTGDAGLANIKTGADVDDAQRKIQARFQSINEMLRGGASTYTNTDQHNAHQVAAVAGSIQFR